VVARVLGVAGERELLDSREVEDVPDLGGAGRDIGADRQGRIGLDVRDRDDHRRLS
jgi:hypothetical protein